jgi:hypothetical protein
VRFELWALQTLYHLSHTPSPFCFRYFSDRVSPFCWGSVLDHNPHTCVSHEAGIKMCTTTPGLLIHMGSSNFSLWLALNHDPLPHEWLGLQVWATTVLWIAIYKKIMNISRCQWLTPIILATQKAEIGRIAVQSQSRQRVCETLILKKPITKMGWWSSLRCRPWVQTQGPQKNIYIYIFFFTLSLN